MKFLLNLKMYVGYDNFQLSMKMKKNDKLKSSENANKKENLVSENKENDSKQDSSPTQNPSTKKSGSKFKRFIYTSTFLIGVGAAGIAYLTHINPSVRNGLNHHAPIVIEYLQKIPGFGEGNSKSYNEEGHSAVIVENVKDDKTKKKNEESGELFNLLGKIVKEHDYDSTEIVRRFMTQNSEAANKVIIEAQSLLDDIDRLQIKLDSIRSQREGKTGKELSELDQQLYQDQQLMKRAYTKIEQLLTQLEERRRWERSQLQEALKYKEELDNRRFQGLLSETINKLDKEFQDKVTQLLETQQKDFNNRLDKALSTQEKQILEKEQQKLRGQEDKLKNILQTQMEHQKQLLIQAFNEEYQNRQVILDKLRLQVASLQAIIDFQTSSLSINNTVNRLCVALISLDNVLEHKQPFANEATILRDAAPSDRVIEATINPLLNSGVADFGVWSRSLLKERFQLVRKNARRTAFVPKDGGLWWQLFSQLLAIITVPEKGFVDENRYDSEALLARAEFYLEKGELYKAVTEIEQLTGWPAKLAQDWIQAARERLIVEQNIELIKAHVYTLAAAHIPVDT